MSDQTTDPDRRAQIRPAPPKSEWADHADTTLAHERGSLTDAQLKAEGRDLAAEFGRAENKPEAAQARPNGETAQAAPARTAEDLEALTVPELKERARALDIDGYSSMVKADLAKAIRAARS